MAWLHSCGTELCLEAVRRAGDNRHAGDGMQAGNSRQARTVLLLSSEAPRPRSKWLACSYLPLTASLACIKALRCGQESHRTTEQQQLEALECHHTKCLPMWQYTAAACLLVLGASSVGRAGRSALCLHGNEAADVACGTCRPEAPC